MHDNGARKWRVLSTLQTWRVYCPFNCPTTLSNDKHDTYAVLIVLKSDWW